MTEPDRVCPTCAEPNPARARFCLACGAPVTAVAAPRGREERKVVSVVFADLVGFTAQAEQLDPEEVRAILAPYHARLRAELERHGGTVEKFIGDAVMALFGAPVAHEDDAERAVRAALAIRESLNEDGRLHIRVGITTGEALVALDASPGSGEGMASGDVVNTAARLQAAAPVDGVLVDEATFRATSRVISYEAHPPLTVKGKAQPVAVRLAVSAISRLGSDVGQAVRTSLIGRASELQLLIGAMDRAHAGRQPQLVTIAGVPGIGKSRLVHELLSHAERSSELITWRQGRCLPYAESISFWALGEIVKAECGILETDTAEAAMDKIAASVADVVNSADDAPWVARHLGMLIGAQTAGELRGDHRGEAFAAWRRYLEALAEGRPTVLVFEDLHWADDGLLDFIDGFVDWATDVPLLVVGTARPELFARRAGWAGGKTNAISISLAPLSDGETRSLVAALVEQAVIPRSLSERVLDRAQGNPLYAEEFARLVAERGPVDDLPESVHGIIAARLDGLAREDKELLQDAAVVGKVFWSGALVAMRGIARGEVEERLHALERRELVRRDRRSSLANETEYSFRHILVRDVAYGQIPRAARAERHTRVAAWIEGHGRAAEHAELLAGHHVAALELARATNQPIEPYAAPARSALLQAGQRALGLSAFATAARHYRAAVDLMPADAPERPAALFGYGKPHRVAEEKGTSELAEAEAGLAAAGDLERAAEAAVLQAELAWFGGQGDVAATHLARAAAMVEDLPPSHSKAYVLSDLSRYSMLKVETDRAVAYGERAVAIAEQLGLDEVRAHALNNIGTARHDAGDPAGLEDMEKALEIATQIRSREAARVHINLSAAYWRDGEMKRSNELLKRALEVARELGDFSSERFARMGLPSIHWSRGEWDEALQLLDEQIAEAEAQGGHAQEGPARSTRSFIRLARGDRAGAIDDGRRALAASRQMDEPQMLIPTLCHMIWLHGEGGELDEQRRLVEELLAQPALHDYVGIDALVAIAQADRDDALAAVMDKMREGWHSRVGRLLLDGGYDEAAALLVDLEQDASAAMLRLEAGRRLLAADHVGDAQRQLDLASDFWVRVGASHYLAKIAALRDAAATKASVLPAHPPRLDRH